MALFGNSIGSALGMQSAEEYTSSVEAADRLQKLQRANLARENQLKYGVDKTQREGADGVAPLTPDDAFSFDNLTQPGLRDVPVEPERFLQEVPPEAAPSQTITPPEVSSTPPSSTPSEPLTVPNYDPMAEESFDKIGRSGVVDITQVDPESSAFAQDIQELFAKGDFQSLFNRLGDRAAIGYGDTLAGSPAGRIYGYFTDSPAEAKARSKSVAAAKWYRTEAARKYFLQNPDQLTAASVDPTGWYNQFKEEQPKRQAARNEQRIVTNSRSLADKRIASLTSDERLKRAFKSDKVQTVRSAAAALGVDPNFATAIMGIESSFGEAKNLTSTKGAKGIMQVMPDTFDYMRVWYTNPSNIAQYNIPDNVVNAAKSMKKGSMTDPTAGLLYLKYGEYLGVPKNLLAAGYQGGMEAVLKLGKPTGANDGALTNTDYNRTVISVYNSIVGSGASGTMPTSAQATPMPDAAGDPRRADTTSNMPVVESDGGGAVAMPDISTAQATTVDRTVEVPTVEVDGRQETSVASPDVDPDITKFLKNPPNIGIETQNLLDQRELAVSSLNRQLAIVNDNINRNNAKVAEYERMAQVARISGDLAGYERYRQAADTLNAQSLDLKQRAVVAQDQARAGILEFDNKLLLVQGAQAVQDLSFGSTARAGAVLSAYSGTNIQVVPRSDGQFDITVQGERQATYSMADLSDKLQSTFSSAYREQKQKTLSERNTYLFEKGVDLQVALAEEEVKILGRIKEENVKGENARFLERIKQDGGEFKALGDGTALIRQGTEYYRLNPEAVVEVIKDGKKVQTVRPQLEKLDFATAQLLMGQADMSGDAYDNAPTR